MTIETEDVVEHALALREECRKGVIDRGAMPDYVDACVALNHLAPKLLTVIERLREENARLVERVSDEGGKIVRAFVSGWFEALDLGDMEPAEYQKYRERACGAGIRYLRDLLDPQANEARAALNQQ